jgi:23S rRNA (guanosine2251-2'-O)-methyltransferase
VLVATGLRPDPRLEEIRRLARVEEVAPARLESLARGAAHQGVVAEVAPRRRWSLRELLASAPDLLLALDGVQDPRNLGAILRSAEAAGAGGVLLPERRSAHLSPAAVKASAGAVEHMRICHVPGVAGALLEVRKAGLWCVALDPEGEMAAWEFDFRQPVCVVVGGEGQGLGRLVRERCDARVRLPMRGRVASLNASAASAALLYEVGRQRSTPE